MNKEIKQLNAKAQKYSVKVNKVLNEVKKVIVGQEEILDRILVSMIADGHVLLESVPGLAKTMMIRSISDAIKSRFCRIQFTPDLLPADIVGTKMYNHKKGNFLTKKGPIFSNIVLADEINRAPPKVQSALLEAMQERQVSIHGDSHVLEKPFLVLATQNPIESEGTYRLPEAQVDRFLFKLQLDYPSHAQEMAIIRGNTQKSTTNPKTVLSPKELLEIQNFCKEIYADEKIEHYVASLVEATRNPKKYGVEAAKYIEYGASPRASIGIVLAAKAHALLQGRGYVMPEDVQAIAADVLRHRVLLNYEAQADDVTSDQIIGKILSKVKVP